MTVDVAPNTPVSTSASVVHETPWSTDPRITPAIDHTGNARSTTADPASFRYAGKPMTQRKDHQ